MNEQAKTRRAFLKATSVAVAGAALADQAVLGIQASETKPADSAKILNYHPKMGYRRLGKAGVMISEIGLGGHGGRDPSDRVPILERAVELGINYLDTNIVQECELYGKALRGKRKNWYIGFGSWPEKLTSEYEKELSREQMAREIDGRLKHYNTDTLDLWRPVGATWGPGQTAQETMLEVSPRVLDLVVEVFEKARQQGKVRWLGISAHNPKVFRRVLNDYPQFSVILFPYLFLTKAYEGDSLLALAKEKDMGVIGIKPFAAGATFAGKPGELQGTLDKRAPVLLRAMLREPRISAIIPGVLNREQLEENVKGSYERHKPLDAKDKDALRECRENFYANLTPCYQWLHAWTSV